MRRIRLGLVLITTLCVLPTAVEAREVVEFSDGRYLEIRSYAVQGDLIRLDVERGSFMVIPVVSVDEIRRNRDVVFSSTRPVLPGPREARASSARTEPPDGPRSGGARQIGGRVTAGS